MIHFVSIVSEDFWPGVAALFQSIQTNSGLSASDYRFTLLCDPRTAPTDWLQGTATTADLMPLSALRNIKLLAAQKQGRRMEVALQKCAVFALPPSFGHCVYLDADMLCVGSLRGIEDMSPLTLTAELPDFTEALTPDVSASPGFECNTGFFVFRPDHRIYEQLHDTYQRRYRECFFKGDQDVINLWLREKRVPYKLLGAEWNFAKRYVHGFNRQQISEKCENVRFLHFVGAKPWTSNADINSFRECRYQWMENIWWDYFESSGFAQHMSKPPNRRTAWLRARILPWTKPAILREHAQRVCRLGWKVVSCPKLVRLSSG
jgi:hypothetical protein